MSSTPISRVNHALTFPHASIIANQQFFPLLRQAIGSDAGHKGGVTADAAGGGGGAGVVAPLFHVSEAPSMSHASMNLLAHAATYFAALQQVATSPRLVNPDDQFLYLPVNPLFANAYRSILDDRQGRFQMPPVATYQAFNQFTSAVDNFMNKCPVPSLAAAIDIDSVQVLGMHPRMPVVGPQGMGKTYTMLRDVSLKRSSNLTNRVIYVPHCGAWVRSCALLYLINAVMVAFQGDNAVLAACQQVRQIVDFAHEQPTPAVEAAVTHLLSFSAMYCYQRKLRLFFYADHLSSLMEERSPGTLYDHMCDFPFSILHSKCVPFWNALGVVVITAVSNTNNVQDEVNNVTRNCFHFVDYELSHPLFSCSSVGARDSLFSSGSVLPACACHQAHHFKPTEKFVFLSRYTPSERDVYLSSLTSAMINAPDEAQKDTITDYTGLLPFECKDLADFIAQQHSKQPVVSGARLTFSASQWWDLLEQWKYQRFAHFEQLLRNFDDRHISKDMSIARSNAARMLELDALLQCMPLSFRYDRRLIFENRINGQLMSLHLEALSPLVRLLVIEHYPHQLSGNRGAQALDKAVSRMFSAIGRISNDVKSRLVKEYILHRIREAVARRLNASYFPIMQGHPWQQARGDTVKLDFRLADVVDFPGHGLPPASMLGDLTRPKFYFPMRKNYPEFDLFVWLPGVPANGRKRKAVPSTLLRCAISLNIADQAGFDPAADAALASWQVIFPVTLPGGIPSLTELTDVWVGPVDQPAPVAARGVSSLLSLER